MKFVTIILTLLLIAACAHVSTTPLTDEKEKLLGAWNGQLETPGGSLTVVLRFEKTEAGEIVGFADSPDQGGFGIPVTDIEMEDGAVTIKVSSLRAEYKGKLGDNEIVGEFKQGPQPIPLTLKRGEYEAKTNNLDLSDEVMDKLLGSWNGPLEAPGASLTVVFRFEKTKEGNFVAFHDSPDQGGKGLPVTEATFSDGTVTLKIKGNNAEFKGNLTGDEMVGEWTQRGINLPLTLKKGEYKAPEYSLSLSEEAMDQLLGEWQGKLGPLTLVFRFEKTEKGDFKGFIDSPDQGANGIKITEAALTDGRLEFKVKVPTAEFSGQLSGNSLVGEWKQMGQSNPLTLTKE